ncbi:hypothetical protein RclHR1_03460002 [Rhizophagus clarus]|uniref:Uncharacterized protein n=1 Tax=Rhizophagus clarus TaxID=94130 RepID=A0A2Z6RAT8_9GLOM|nr:hypothetical protein RclHR1_03460002 [Rhizophagus clarus]
MSMRRMVMVMMGRVGEIRNKGDGDDRNKNEVSENENKRSDNEKNGMNEDEENENVDRHRNETETACGFYIRYDAYQRYFCDVQLDTDLKIDNTNEYIELNKNC